MSQRAASTGKTYFYRHAIHLSAESKFEKVCIIETSRGGIMQLLYNACVSPYFLHR